jgi:hypothetical protein
MRDHKGAGAGAFTRGAIELAFGRLFCKAISLLLYSCLWPSLFCNHNPQLELELTQTQMTQKPAFSKHIINCFQHIPGSCGALHSPYGGAPQQRRPLTPQHALIGFTPTPTHPSAVHTLHTRARPYLLSRHRPHAQRSRAHFTPQHWLLCHLGLY